MCGLEKSYEWVANLQMEPEPSAGMSRDLSATAQRGSLAASAAVAG